MDGDIAQECHKEHDAKHVKCRVNKFAYASKLAVAQCTRVDVVNLFHNCIILFFVVHIAKLHIQWAKMQHIKYKLG